MLNQKVRESLETLGLSEWAVNRIETTVVREVVLFGVEQSSPLKVKRVDDLVLVRFGKRDFAFREDGDLEGSGMSI